ncbi:MAG: hypothetical protein E3K36_16755 [Candidatus Brocadia sp.]|nr:hypothetical protein [Candidatus Brocadia sp.]
MKMISHLFIVLLSVLFITTSCATKRPVLYPNEHLNTVGREVADKDIDECFQLAKAHAGKYRTEKKIAEQTAVSTAIGAATGAAVGAVAGDAGRGAAAGAAGGAASGLIFGLFKARDPDPLVRQYMEECLGDKGYTVIGWE